MQRKAKAQLQPQPVGQPPVQDVFIMRESTPHKLIDVAARESTEAQFVRL